ncbi:MAG TPA: hypothetical protein VIL20_11805 [Sandaracinaceae bacterium]
MSRLVLLALVLALTACESDPVPHRPDTGTSEPGVTYYGHVRPILVENCVMCHVEGGVGPFALTTYEGVVEVADRVKQVTADRIMPPFLADNSGRCNTWSNYRGLTDEEIATIGAWVDMGTPEGDPTTPEPPAVELPQLDSVDVTLEMPLEYTVNDAFEDEYRCFVTDPGLTENKYLVGYDVHPGNVQRVHHLIVYAPVDEAAANEARELDAADGNPTDGYTCFGAARVDAIPIVLWAPGTGATEFPRGTGIQLTAGRPLIMQLHYNNQVDASVPATDRTSVDLALADNASPALMAPIIDSDLHLPPRTPEVVETSTLDLSVLPFSVRVWGIFPHMHTLGRSIRLDINRGGTTPECMIDVPRWDFHWQMAYWATEPIRVSPEDSVTITCTFDTRSRETTTTFGEGTQDEMCLAFVYATL